MTEPRPPLSDDDLSALLDGEAGPDVAARAQADPAALARLDALRGAAAAVRAAPVTPLPSATVDDLVARALAVADEAPAGPDDVVATTTPVGDDGGAEAIVAPLRPRGGAAGVPRWLVAAAVVLLVAVGLSLVWSGRDDGTETATTNQALERADDADGSGGGSATEGEGSADQGDDAAAQEELVPSSPAPPSAGESPSRGVEVTDLGEFATLDELRSSLATSFPTDLGAVADADAPSGAAVLRCQQLMVEVFALEGEPTAIGQATVDGQPYLVYEFDAVSAADGTTPTTFLTVNDPTSCDAVRSFERTPG